MTLSDEWERYIDDEIDVGQMGQAVEDADHQIDSLKRVLYHVVHSYNSWRDVPNMMPNELLDNAVDIGRKQLEDLDWWPDE